jgi:hypothetical protein
VAGAKQRLRPPEPGDPEVLLDVECVDGRLYLVLANVGEATAFDVRVEFKRPLPGVGGEVDIAALRVFRGLPLLRPGRELRVFVDTASALLQRKQSRILRAQVSYDSRYKRGLGERFRHDLRIWQDFGEVRPGTESR